MATPVIISTNGYGTPVVSVASGGLPVSTATNGYGSPVVIATNGYGTPVTFDNRAVLLAGSYLSAVTLSFPDNYLIIRDPVTPANNYNGPLITAGAFNKFTYTRASTATFVGSNGLIQTAASSVPRIEYDPVTLAVKGYLAEGARTNLCLQSETFDNASWTKAGSTITANVVAAPDGNITADKLVEDSATAEHRCYQAFTATVAPYTWTVFAKAAERSWVSIRSGSGTLVANFNVSTGVVGTKSAGATSKITALPNGWYRCEMTGMGQVADAITLNLGDADTGTGTGYSYTGNGTSGLYIWGAQVEQAGAASSYIPTTTVAVTRAADFCSLSGTLFNLTQPSGTMYTKNTWQGGTAVGATRASMTVSDGTFAEYHSIYNLSGVDGATTNHLSVVQASLPKSAVADNVFSKTAYAYALNDLSIVQDGSAPNTFATAVMPTGINLLTLGVYITATLELNGTIQEAAFIGQRITNAAMQAF